MICSVSDTREGRGALETAAAVSKRLGLRLVLAHVASGTAATNHGSEAGESISTRPNCCDAARVLARLAAEYGVADSAERRVAFGDEAARLGEIAAEEAADVIVVGGRARGRLRRSTARALVDQLETETPVPVLIAPTRTSGIANRRQRTGRGANVGP